MPTFVFRSDDGRLLPAHEAPLPRTIAEAKCEAVKIAGRIMCDEAESFWEKKELSLTVTDETGLTLFQLLVVGVEAAAAGASNGRNVNSAR